MEWDYKESKKVTNYNKRIGRCKDFDVIYRWRHSKDTHRDTGLIRTAVIEYRPLELQARLRRGKHAGGIQIAEKALAERNAMLRR